MPPDLHLDRLILITTDVCDSRCRACHIWRIQNPDQLSPDALRRLLLESESLRGLRRVNISGGEPCQYPHLGTMVDLIRQRFGSRVLLSCITNGLYVDDVWRESVHMIEGGPAQVFVSLDGVDRDTYRRTRGVDGLERAVEALDRLIALRGANADRLRVGLSFTIMRQNYDRLWQAFEFARSRGVDFIARVAGVHRSFYRVEGGDGFALSLEQLRDVQATLDRIVAAGGASGPGQAYFFANTFRGNVEWRDYDCYAGSRSCCIRANGDVVSCLFSSWAMGNINESAFDAIWESPAAAAARSRIAARECSCWNDSETIATREYAALGDSPRAGW